MTFFFIIFSLIEFLKGYLMEQELIMKIKIARVIVNVPNYCHRMRFLQSFKVLLHVIIPYQVFRERINEVAIFL